ncbi:MAG: tautomerase family protein [Azospirillaceae bacterium]|nr:tautomerase family protein [Azospirillaceae bacterium]
MPEIIVYAVEGRSTAAKHALMRDITEAVARNFEMNPELVTIQIVEASADNKSKGGLPFTIRPPSEIFKS